MEQRLTSIMQFLHEIDKLKHIKRRSHVSKEGRSETVAEHCWHMCMYALVLCDELQEPVDLLKTIKMILVHDLVEIYAGDTFAFDDKGLEDKSQREAAAAERLYGLLPPDLARELHQLWQEFETGDSPEASFARSLDKIQVINQNFISDGYVWRHYGIPEEKVAQRNAESRARDPILDSIYQFVINESKAKGYFE